MFQLFQVEWDMTPLLSSLISLEAPRQATVAMAPCAHVCVRLTTPASLHVQPSHECICHLLSLISITSPRGGCFSTDQHVQRPREPKAEVVRPAHCLFRSAHPLCEDSPHWRHSPACVSQISRVLLRSAPTAFQRQGRYI